jgi:hypothetical protein
MIRTSRLAALLAIATLGACTPKEEAPAAQQPTAAESAPTQEAAPRLALLDACKIRVTQPEVHEFETKWDPARLRSGGQNPSALRSTHWGNEEEKKSAHDMGVVNPLDFVCGTSDDVKPGFTLHISVPDSSMTDVPLAPGTYPITRKAAPAKNKPREFVIRAMILGEALFEPQSGTLKLDRFDMNGAAGSFVIDGYEVLKGSRPLHVEGTFDMPCRKELLHSACTSGKGEQLD